jgi:hypothetical protein
VAAAARPGPADGRGAAGAQQCAPDGAAAGEFLHTLDGVDIPTTWVERQAVLGKSRHEVVPAMTALEAQLPFPVRGVDSDNGSEFINDHLLAWCQQRPAGQPVQFTRSRPSKKDDNAHGEQKNWTHVRKVVGWERDDTAEALAALNALYADLRLFQNLFQPSMKLVRKVRVGSRRIRRYDRPPTPFERGRACADADPQTVTALAPVLTTTDPFALSPRIDRHLERPLGAGHPGQPHAARDGAPATAATGEHAVAWLDLQPEGSAPQPGATPHRTLTRGRLQYGPRGDRRSEGKCGGRCFA